MGNNCLARVSSFAVIQRNSIEIIRISGFDEIDRYSTSPTSEGAQDFFQNLHF